MIKNLFAAALAIGVASTALAQGRVGPGGGDVPSVSSKSASASEPKAKKAKKSKKMSQPMAGASGAMQ